LIDILKVFLELFSNIFAFLPRLFLWQGVMKGHICAVVINVSTLADSSIGNIYSLFAALVPCDIPLTIFDNMFIAHGYYSNSGQLIQFFRNLKSLTSIP
jgi:hypothetical protein